MEINVKFVPHWVSKLAAYHRVPVTEVETVMTTSDLVSYKNSQSIIQHIQSLLGIGSPVDEPELGQRDQLLLDVLGPKHARRYPAGEMNVANHVFQLIPQVTVTMSGDDNTVLIVHDVEKPATEPDHSIRNNVSHPKVRKFIHSLLIAKSSRMTESELFTSKVFNRYLSAELDSTAAA